ncbi:MAG: hypothetical protein JJ922_16900 [Parvibaculum sp.]|nr:hypothetical protein [Parvibaculum sp.]MBO6693681.1 hypothetical protein [Parvibaculum sp.]MBO6716293.1 hypothetical protein [Parvibaculum sp.]
MINRLYFQLDETWGSGQSACTLIAKLLHSDSRRVRIEATGHAALTDDIQLIQKFVESGWSAETPKDGESIYEEWYGSLALLNAAARDLISHDCALERMSPRLYGRAAKTLSSDAVKTISQRINASINRLADLEPDTATPDIELQFQSTSAAMPIPVSVSEREVQTNDPFKTFERFSESDEDFDKRQKKYFDAFLAFKNQLTDNQARIVLDSIELEEFEAVVEADPETANRWCELFLGLTTGLSNVHNFALLLGYALSKRYPEKTARLFRHFRSVRPLVRYTFGAAGLPLAAVAIWASADDPAIEELRYERLDRAENDDELAQEILAALWEGKENLLFDYIDMKLKTNEPAQIARALMVAGFTTEDRRADDVLRRYKDSCGFLGSAHKVARQAYERNVWSQYWFRAMCEAPDPDTFWRYSVLLGKIVDGRIRTWRDDVSERREPMMTFAHSVEEVGRKRIKKWSELRRKTLFGQEAPDPIFLGVITNS